MLYPLGGDFPFQIVLNGLLDFGGDALQIIHVHLPLVEGPDHAVDDLVPVEVLPGTVALHHDDGQGFHNFIGGKPAQAAHALPTAPDAQSVIGVTGVDNFAFLLSAKRTFHGRSHSFHRITQYYIRCW